MTSRTTTPAPSAHPSPSAGGAPAFAGLAALATGTGPALQVTAPADGRPLGAVRQASGAEIDVAVARARAAQKAWARTPAKARAAVVRRFASLVLDRRDEILDVIEAETGKARLAALEEAMDASRTAAYYAHTAPGLLRPRRRGGAFPVLTQTTERRHPKGVVGVITPWNYPFTLPASDSVPALLAGNAVVIKPDEKTPFSALLALSLLREAGLPEGVAQVVVGARDEAGPALVEAADYIMFTGSSATGRKVAARCGERLIGFSAELGGKNPLIVLADADVPAAAAGAARACFANAGQLCIGPERIYVHEAVRARFTEAFLGEVGRMRVAGGAGWDAEMGSLISDAQLAKVRAHVEDAVAQGARILAGGGPRPELGPYFFAPTVLADVPETAALCREETFGPVVAIYPVASEEEAIARANNSELGLNASLWTRAARGAELGARLEAGTVNVNEGYAASWGSLSAPMGGWKASGVGRRHGAEGLLKYTEAQTVSVQRLLRFAPLPGMANERYADLLTGAVRVLNRFR
ncbi:succinate-semialdehyde dehydrogenase/glutarate-semialdehyde dehydrogenase [Sinomonas atrocyanea]|uniref:succinic semialdehyde dehydrogenase n=1 Tax=Sinomonas atrocyanea TaxID=37927 RepID=UPI00278679F0|nr:succinic semialdehyde dehydrogenase [Sinomonas atrocyanea]MDQ0259189.1 succinate-semialdehyde dehydrogenase/glutarate-semialdehyde dehydrogenase [Sinomonas atrocyanea]